jgi:RND superfamily putative drug exporter
VLRGLVVLAVLGLWLAVAALGGQAQGRLSEVQENDAAAFLPAGAESTQAARAAAAFSESETLPALVVVEAQPPGSTLSPEQLAAVQEFAAAVPGLPVEGTGQTVGDLLTGPVVAIPAQDGQAVLVPVPLDSAAASQSTEDEERVVNVVVDGLRQSADAAFDSTGLEAWVTGPAGAIADLVTAFGGIDGLLLGVAVLVVLIILVLVYRSPSLPFAVIFTSLFGLTAASLVVYELAAAGTIDLNGQSQGILFILVVGAATDYALLLVARYREELTKVESVYVAMRRAWRASLPPISASAGTVIAGVLCLLLSDLSSNASLGPVAAIGIAAAYLAAMTFLPALLLIAGRRSRAVFWPRIPRPVPAGAVVEAQPARRGLWERLADVVTRRDRLVWVVTAVVLVGFAAFLPTLRASGTNEADVFLTEVESVTGEDVLAAHFDAGQVQPVVVVAPEEDADAVVAAAGAVDGVSSAAVQTTAPGSPEPLVVDGTVLVNAVTVAGSDTQEAVDVVRDVREAVHAVSPGALVGGAAAQRLDLQETSASDLRTIVPVVLGVILVVLVLLLRAVVAPAVILVANVLSFGASVGVSAIVFNHVLGFPGADPAVVLYAFVFLVALGIDYTIFLMTRVREESLVHGTRAGLRRGLAVTGGVITSAGLVLAATFGALSVIPLLFLAQISFIVAFGVLLDTFVVRSLLVPGVIHDIGRPAWWPWTRRIPLDEPEPSPTREASTVGA